MARNIEIKARIASVETLVPSVAQAADEGPIGIVQDDTFFPCTDGRLKLRVRSPEDGELIFYRRPDQPGPKESFYLIAPTAAPDALREVLTRAYGLAGRVRKKRTFYRVGRTRVHLDRVEGLGDFLELEVVLADGEPTETGIKVANGLMQQFGIGPEQLVEGAYLDLLLARTGLAASDADQPESAPAAAPARPTIQVRRATAADGPQIVEIFYNTVQRVNILDYTPEQVNAWAPQKPDPQLWVERKKDTHRTWIAEVDGLVVGFGELEGSGHIDCFYVHHEHLGQGVGRAIYRAIEEEARRLGVQRLFTEVSTTARLFFEGQGFVVIKTQTIERSGVRLKNYVMEKILAAGAGGEAKR